MLLFFLILFQLEPVNGFQCMCSGADCADGCQAGSYCKTTWIVAGGAVKDTGCVTTRTDLTEQKCKTNRKGLVTCLCDSERCNDASFSIPSDVALTVPPTIKCYNSDLNEDNFCFGHYCLFQIETIMNDFGDVFPSPYQPTRGCTDDEYNDDLDSVNVCYLSNGYIRCKCNTQFCNKGQPYPVPLGSLLCYSAQKSSPSALKYCKGHLCYRLPPDYDGFVVRGCLSVSDGAPEELKIPGTFESFQFCNENLCNGDYTENAIVGNVEATTPVAGGLESTTVALS